MFTNDTYHALSIFIITTKTRGYFMARTLLINYGVNTGGINMNNAKILTVDDQPEDLDIVNHILRRDEYDVVSANNGLEAINMLDNNPDISIIILDRMMPIMDGLSFMHRIRQIEEYNNIPALTV